MIKAFGKVCIDRPVKPSGNLFFPLANNSWAVITRWQIIVQTMKRGFFSGWVVSTHLVWMFSEILLHPAMHSPFVLGRFRGNKKAHLNICEHAGTSGDRPETSKKIKSLKILSFFSVWLPQLCFQPGSFKKLINYELIKLCKVIVRLLELIKIFQSKVNGGT